MSTSLLTGSSLSPSNHHSNQYCLPHPLPSPYPTSGILLPPEVAPAEVQATGREVPESDGAGAETDVVRGGGTTHGTRLAATFSPPAAPLRFLPFQVVSDISRRTIVKKKANL